MPDFEKSVIDHLKSSGIGADHLAELARNAALVNSSGLKAIKILNRGTPVPDWVKIAGIADKVAIQSLIEKLVNGHLPGAGGISVFPYGIPRPDLFNVEVTLGHTGP